MADMVRSVPSKVVEYLVAAVGRRCGNVTFYDSYVHRLIDEILKLEHRREQVQLSVDDARNHMRLIIAEVERWLQVAESVTNKARDVLEYDERAKKTCFYGWLPNPKVRYCLGREARRTIEDVQALILQSVFGREHNESPPPGHVAGPSDVKSSASDWGDTITDSRFSIFQGIMEALDDEELTVIGVYGPGGVGKTILLKEVEKKLRKKGTFPIIVKAKVSQIPVFKNIQGKIADALKDVQSDGDIGYLLLERLPRDPSEKVLVILEDLSEELDLKAVGIPSGDMSGKYKLLLTSRSKDVLEQKMRADRTFHLQGLNNDEAFRLFYWRVGDWLKDNEELKAIAVQMVKKLAGLPLFIISVTSTLKYSGVYAWKKALIKLDVEKPETIVKLSYDHLNNEDAKLLFLLCGLIGGTIQVETLLGLGLGLGWFERYSKAIEDARTRVKVTLDSLCSVGLLQDSGDYMKDVTINDLYSEVVVSTPFRGQNSLMMNSNYGLWPKEKLEKCWAIYLVNVSGDRLAELMLCRFTNLKILMLCQPEDWLESPAHQYDEGDCCRLDFTYMKELRVLYLCSMHITPLFSSMEILENLQASYLDCCHVEDVAILGKLKALQILSFAGSTISRLPKEIGELTNLRLLNLSNCKELHVIEPGVLKRLINLEELYMMGSFDRWIGNDGVPSEPYNASLAELKSLTKLRTLEILIPDPTVLLEDGDLPFGNLFRFWINIGNVDRRGFKSWRNMKLKLEGYNSILSKEWFQKTLQRTQYLHLDGLRDFEKIESAHELCILGFFELKHLEILNSPSIEYITSSSYPLLVSTFTRLESLFLENLINLKKICHGLVALECFAKLKAVRIKKCHLLETLWFLSEMQVLVHLEEIQVCECDSMRAVITDDAIIVEVAADDIVELSNVRHLNLHKLPNMMSFCTRANRAPIQVAFPRLEILEINGLDNLGFMFLPSVVKYLAQLRELRVSNCMNIGAIIMEEEGWGMEALETLAFSMLTVLHLQHLEHLTCFSRAKCSQEARSQDGLKSTILFNQEVKFPNLETLEIFEMNNINMIWDNQVCFRHLKTLEVSSCDGLSHIFTPTIVGNLVELKNLTITSCEILTQVMVDEGGEEGHVVAFKQLKYLKLHMLAGLQCFSSGGYTLVFPLLENVILVGCPNIKFFSERPIKAPKLDEVTKREMSFWKENLNIMSQKLLAMVAGEKKMRLSEFPMLTGKWHSQLNFIKSSWQLESLMVDKCSSFINAIPFRLMLVFNNMKTLQVHDCESLEEIFDLEGLEGVERTWVLPSFMTLELVNLPKLRRLWNKNLQGMLRFDSLQGLTLHKCSNLRHAFAQSMAQCLANLQWMEIKECSQMEEVIGEEEGQGSTVEKITFSNLDRIKLECLPNLTSFLSGKNHMFECPKLVDLSIAQCPKMRSLTWQSSMATENGTPSLFTSQVVFPSLEELHITDIGYIKMIWDNHVALSFPRHFQHLKTLDVSHCIMLSNMFTTTMAGNLVKLTKLRISNCKMLTEIISDEGCKEGPIVAFKQLKYMELEDLIGLTCFSSGRYTLLFPLLEDLIVTGCLNMKFFSEAPLRAPKLKLKRVQVSTEMWFWNKKIRLSMQNMSIDMDTVDGVEFMHLSGFSKLTEKWHSKLIPIKSSWQLKSLVVDSCPSFLNAIPSRLMLVLDKINTLQVKDCKQLEEIFDLEGLEAMESTRVLPQLWCLNLINLPELRQLWNKDLQGMLCFSSLSYLTLYKCSNLRHALAPSMAQCLPTLQWMEIKKCGQMEGVIAEEGGKGTEVEKITFPRLRWMELERLPNLNGFPSGDKYMLECPMLQELTIVHCPKIISFNWQSLMKIDQGISSHFTPRVLFPRVKSMVLSHMDSSRKTGVDGSQHLWKVEAFEKLRVDFCVIEETSSRLLYD